MSDLNETNPTTNKPKEWTLMFYFASDNPLAPGVVSQLKALKNAGYHHGANVVAYFDPQTPGTPTHTFDVNAIEKLEDPNDKIGYMGYTPNDPFVRNLMRDKLWGSERSRNGELIREILIQELASRVTFDPPMPPSYKDLPAKAGKQAKKQKDDKSGEHGPQRSLKAFLHFCAKYYTAKRYMLFILGHGLVVGDDVFLYDEHADKHSLKLKDLGTILRDFKKANAGAEFDLVSFHSCSMSSLELAFELRDSANYMLAAQGPAYVGSWPYTQILIRVFNDLDDLVAAHEKAVGATNDDKLGFKATLPMREEMLGNIFEYVVHNSTDFMLAGYSFDLCLCDLKKISRPETEEVLKDFANALAAGVVDPLLKNCILLAHWKAQSYWQETYTDLYDFCFCLGEYCEAIGGTGGNPQPFKDLGDKCARVMEVLAKRDNEHPYRAVLQAEYAGPDSQYSHGFSVFFPWAAPAPDRTIAQEYQGSQSELGYLFNSTGWYSFLKEYWGENPGDGTKRQVHKEEFDKLTKALPASNSAELLEDMVSLMFNYDGPLNTTDTLNEDSPQLTKVKPRDPTGDECTCGSIKNYPRDTRPRRQRSRVAFDHVLSSSTTFIG